MPNLLQFLSRERSATNARRNAERTGLLDRLPPGQTATAKFPILHYGSIPPFDSARWRFRVSGLVEVPLDVDWQAFQRLPTSTVTCDVHCVTRWSKLGTRWEGVPFAELSRLVRPQPTARYVMAHCAGGYTTNLPLGVLYGDDVLLAYRYEGEPLAPEHGYPLRLLVPKRYFWKSAKWLNGLEFTAEDRPGFWERNGYSSNADPWLGPDGQRYTDD